MIVRTPGVMVPLVAVAWTVTTISVLQQMTTAFQPVVITSATSSSSYHQPTSPIIINRQQPHTTRQRRLDMVTQLLSSSSSSSSSVSSADSSSSSSRSSSHNNNNITSEVLDIPDPYSQDDRRQRPHHQQLQTPVTTFTTIEECLNAMDESISDLTVILYFAHYCKKCHHANIPYKRLAYQNPQISFTRLETSVMTSTQLKSLGISRVPFLQIYRNGICVASFSTPWKLETQLSQTLDICQDRSITDWMNFVNQHDQDIQSNKDARKQIRSEVLEEAAATAASPGTTNTNNGRPVQTIASERQLVAAIDQSRTSTNSFNDDNEDDLLDGNSIGRAILPTTPSSTSSSQQQQLQDQDRPVVIMFHSHFGHASMRAQHQFTRVAEQLQPTQFQFYRMESSTLSDQTLHELGISKYPHIQVYRHGRCVASFSIPQTYLFSKMVRQTLDELHSRTDDEWNNFLTQHEDLIVSNQQIIESIRQRQVGP